MALLFVVLFLFLKHTIAILRYVNATLLIEEANKTTVKVNPYTLLITVLSQDSLNSEALIEYRSGLHMATYLSKAMIIITV